MLSHFPRRKNHERTPRPRREFGMLQGSILLEAYAHSTLSNLNFSSRHTHHSPIPPVHMWWSHLLEFDTDTNSHQANDWYGLKLMCVVQIMLMYWPHLGFLNKFSILNLSSTGRTVCSVVMHITLCNLEYNGKNISNVIWTPSTQSLVYRAMYLQLSSRWCS